MKRPIVTYNSHIVDGSTLAESSTGNTQLTDKTFLGFVGFFCLDFDLLKFEPSLQHGFSANCPSYFAKLALCRGFPRHVVLHVGKAGIQSVLGELAQ